MGKKSIRGLHVDHGICTVNLSCHSLIFPPKVQAAFKVDLELRAAIIMVKCSLNSSSERELHLLRKRSCWEIKLGLWRDQVNGSSMSAESQEKVAVNKERKWSSEAGVHGLGRCLLIIFRTNIIAPSPADGFGMMMWLRKCEFSLEVRACPYSTGELMK